jgi:hypothetical protein
VIAAVAEDGTQPREPLMTVVQLAADLGDGIIEGTLAQQRFRRAVHQADRQVLYHPEAVDVWLTERERSEGSAS